MFCVMEKPEDRETVEIKRVQTLFAGMNLGPQHDTDWEQCFQRNNGVHPEDKESKEYQGWKGFNKEMFHLCRDFDTALEFIDTPPTEGKCFFRLNRVAQVPFLEAETPNSKLQYNAVLGSNSSRR